MNDKKETYNLPKTKVREACHMISQIRAFINMFGYVMLAMGVVIGAVGLTGLFFPSYLTGFSQGESLQCLGASVLLLLIARAWFRSSLGMRI